MISIVTITARALARLPEMADSLAKAFYIANEPATEWIIVDALLWQGEATAHARLDDVKYLADNLPFSIQHVPPKKSRWHGPWKDTVLGDRELPDTNGARNTGLIQAHRDSKWIGLLDDCSVVSPNYLEAVTAFDPCIGLSLWWERGDIYTVWEPRGDGHHPRRTNATNGFRGSAVFYPTEALVHINGWDESFSGERSGNDLEAAIRLERAGLPLYVNFKAGVREHPHVPIFDATSYHTERNDSLLEQVINDTTWVHTRGTALNIADERAKLDR